MTPSTTTPTKAGYMMIFLAWAASSSAHFRDSVSSFSTSASMPLCSPARTRLTNTRLKICGKRSSAWDRVLPPSMSSMSAEMTSRKRSLSTLSRRSASPSRMGTPARVSCSR